MSRDPVTSVSNAKFKQPGDKIVGDEDFDDDELTAVDLEATVSPDCIIMSRDPVTSRDEVRSHCVSSLTARILL